MESSRLWLKSITDYKDDEIRNNWIEFDLIGSIWLELMPIIDELKLALLKLEIIEFNSIDNLNFS